MDLPVNSGEPKIFTEHGIREALIAYVSRNCCYGSEAAKRMDIHSIVMSQSYRYISEAVTECREVSWKSVPYDWTMVIDGPENGVPVSMWDVSAQPPKGYKFKKVQVSYEMPHTSSQAKCSKCLQTGNTRCISCDNTGLNSCSTCNGSGRVTEQIGGGKSETRNCTWCQGRGRITCRKCNGSGLVECVHCSGSGFVKTFQELQVSWEASSQMNIIKKESFRIPEYMLSKVTGEATVHLTNGCDANDNPLNRFPDSGVRAASLKTFEKYNDVRLSVHNRKVLKIRQTIITILVAEVVASWKGKNEVFFVYGNEKRVFFPNGYPQDCCWWKSPFSC